ncbi:hypothetical protein DRQ23_03355 [bacterium]|nr:MAG: hypothetical protein DRQ23_03355 [bacterium]
MHISTNPWVWIAAILTLAIYSFLYKDNPFYKFAEHLFMGLSIGYGAVVLWYNSIIPRLWNPLAHGTSPSRFYLLIPIAIGLLSFGIFSKKYSWLIKYPLAFSVGAYAGFSIPVTFEASIFEQISGTILTKQMMATPWLAISNLIMFVGVITTITYFYFSKHHKGLLGKSARTGIVFLMLAFGASFGYTVMARISLLIGRMQFLLHDWLGIIK